MNRERLQCIVSGLNRFELTGLETLFIQLVEQDFDREGRLTDQQQSIVEAIYREKTRFIREAISTSKTNPKHRAKESF
jgi:hypothetical protein